MSFKKNGNFAFIWDFHILDYYRRFLASGLRMTRYWNFHTIPNIRDLLQHFHRILRFLLIPTFFYELFLHFKDEIKTNQDDCPGFHHHPPIEIHHHCTILLRHFKALRRVSFSKYRGRLYSSLIYYYFSSSLSVFKQAKILRRFCLSNHHYYFAVAAVAATN